MKHPRLTKTPMTSWVLLSVALATLGQVSLGDRSICHAYVPSTTGVSGTAIHWTDSNCVKLTPHSSGSADITDGKDLAAIKQAVEQWHRAAGHCSYIRFDLQPPTPDTVVGFSKDEVSQNTIIWVEKGWTSLAGHEAQAAGLTTVFFVDSPGSPRDGKILDADMELNGEFFTFSAEADGVADHTDVENTVVHELGHVLGLDHPCDDGSQRPIPKDHQGNTIPSCGNRLSQEMRDRTMYNIAATGEIKKRTPATDDIFGVCETYPNSEDPGVCASPELNPPPLGCTDCGLSKAPGIPWHPGALLVLFTAFGIARRRRTRQ